MEEGGDHTMALCTVGRKWDDGMDNKEVSVSKCRCQRFVLTRRVPQL